jgi:hypothetical protein
MKIGAKFEHCAQDQRAYLLARAVGADVADADWCVCGIAPGLACLTAILACLT